MAKCIINIYLVMITNNHKLISFFPENCENKLISLTFSKSIEKKCTI